MGIGTRGVSSRKRSSSPIAIDCKVIRFRQLVEQHGKVLDIFADLEDKQSGEYILDRQYIEARLGRVYEGVRRVLYDMHVLSDSDSAEGYDQLDRLRSVSEKILKDAFEASKRQTPPSGVEALDWETLALQALFKDMTRAPVYGAGTGPRTPPALAAPESLTEWAGWGHLKAVQWITDHLPRVSPAPIANLQDKETGRFCLQVFVLGGVRDADATLGNSLAREPSGHTDATSLPPLRAFLEGLNSPAGGTGTPRLCLEDRGKQKAGKRAVQLQLYAGEDFLLLRLPSFLPLRLFWASLGIERGESLVYLYGTSLPSLLAHGPREPFVSERQPISAYRCGIAGRWMYWASHSSWAQGEERVRMLGHALAEGVTVYGGGATGENMGKCLGKSIVGFLKQTAMPQGARAEIASQAEE